ncbi:MAG: hypothetical protein ABL901_13210 [Hyphomicrobiaceae bacterium]
MSGSGQPLTVERAWRELARLVAFRDRGALESFRAAYRKPTRFELGTIAIALIYLPVEILGLASWGRWNRHGVRTRFERLQRLDRLISEREDVIEASVTGKR